ncbi:MAG: polyphosphate kinase 2, partial [Pseudomonadota bacterium]
MPDPFPKPFDGAISRYASESAPQSVRDALDGADKDDILHPGYPYATMLKSKPYGAAMDALQIDLMRMQAWVVETGARVAVVFEGRDAAGKGSTIKRLTANLNPRVAQVVALGKPSDVERGEWYFQRYIRALPTAGRITIFDRSWYNRGVVEPVMGFCTETERQHFYDQVPAFEAMLTGDGIHLIKIWLTVGQAEQLRRFLAREADPLKHWKLSPVDVRGLTLWDAYTDA